MTDHTNTYPDLVNVEDWLNAKGYTGEAGACHAAMSLIRRQEARIAELQQEVCSLTRRDPDDDKDARISELKAALKPFADAYWQDDVSDYVPIGGKLTVDDFRAACVTMEKVK